MRKRRRRRQGCLHQRNGSARLEQGKFESLEARTLLSADGLGDPCLHLHSEHADFHAIDSDEVAIVASAVQPSSTISDAGIPVLHSHPTAAQKIYLDFTGHVVHGTGWNELNQGQPIHAPAFDLDGNPKSFSATEVQLIEEVWARVAEDFAPFELDVTTEAPSLRSMRAGSEAIRVLISSNIDSASGRRWFSSGNGVAYMNSWRFQSDTPAWVFANRLGASGKRIAESVSHEVGHVFGLQHDGIVDGEEYFHGHGDTKTGWAPIVGVGYNRPVTQWNAGEYAFSSNSQDDIATIASERNSVRLRVDDHSDEIATARRLATGFAGMANQTGLISTRHDKDLFRLDIEAGTINLMVSGASVGSNLDIEVKLFDAQGGLLETFGSDESLSVAVQTSVSKGTYYLGVDGVGRGNPKTDGYSDYGSLGQYSIKGLIPSNSTQSQPQTAALKSSFGRTILAAVRAQALRYLDAEKIGEEQGIDTTNRWRSIHSHAKAVLYARAAALRLRSRFH